MEELMNQAKEFMNLNPHYGYLIAGIALFVISIGNLANWKWAISPADTEQRAWYNILGPKVFRILMGVVFMIGAIACAFGFYLGF